MILNGYFNSKIIVCHTQKILTTPHFSTSLQLTSNLPKGGLVPLGLAVKDSSGASSDCHTLSHLPSQTVSITACDLGSEVGWLAVVLLSLVVQNEGVLIP